MCCYPLSARRQIDVIRNCCPKTILEIGGGTGHLARELSRQVSQYVLVEPSAGMYSVACKTLDGTDIELCNQTVQEFSKSDRHFDLVLSHLCIQATSDVNAFLVALARTLTASGTFLLSLPHPAFYNDYKKFFPTETFLYTEEIATMVTFTLTLDPGTEIKGVPYYHRPISKYISALSHAGLAVSSMDEIYPSDEIQKLYGAPWRTPRYPVLGGHRGM